MLNIVMLNSIFCPEIHRKKMKLNCVGGRGEREEESSDAHLLENAEHPYQSRE
jgi:hypothetical protein